MSGDWLRFVERGRGAQRAVDRLLVVAELRCFARSPASGRQCTREWKHKGDCERRRRSGAVVETWNAAARDEPAPTTTRYMELLDHVDDLIALARAEGIGRIVAVLSRARAELQYGPAGCARRRRGTRPPLLR